MDTLGALALATEPPTDHLMHRPPVGRRSVGTPLEFNILSPYIHNIFYNFELSQNELYQSLLD